MSSMLSSDFELHLSPLQSSELTKLQRSSLRMLPYLAANHLWSSCLCFLSVKRSCHDAQPTSHSAVSYWPSDFLPLAITNLAPSLGLSAEMGHGSARSFLTVRARFRLLLWI